MDFNNANPSLMKLAELLKMSIPRPSHGYTISEAGPEVVTAPGVYFPSERGEVIPLQSRAEGGQVSPTSHQSDTEKEKLAILRDIISVIKPRQGMESRQFGGSVSPDSEPSLMDQIEKTKYDIFKSAMSVLKPQPQKLPFNERTSAYGSPSGKSQFDPSLPTTPSLPGLPKPITSSSYGMMPEAFKPSEGEALWQKKKAALGWENPAEDLWTHKRKEVGVLDLTSREYGGSTIPGGPRIPMQYEDINPVEEDEIDRLSRLLRLGPPTPEGDITARRTLASTSFPETDELRARERWGTTGYPEKRLEEVKNILGPSVLGVQPGFQESYYEAHPEEKLMDEETARMKPLTDAIMKSIEDARTKEQGYGVGFGPTPNELRLGKGRGREQPSQIPELVQGLKGLTPTLVAGGRRGTLPAGITTPKQPTLSPVGQLMKERDALPPDDPRRASYDAAIKKVSEQVEKPLPSAGNAVDLAIKRKFGTNYLSDPTKSKEADAWLNTPDGRKAVQEARDDLTSPTVTFLPTSEGYVPGTTRGSGVGTVGQPTGLKKPLSDAQLAKVGEINTVLENIEKTKTLYGYGTRNENTNWVGPYAGRKGALETAYLGTASPEQVKFYSYIKDMQDALLRARSGAQINEQEYKRLVLFLPEPNLPPVSFKAKLERFEEATKILMDEKLSAFEKGGLGVNKIKKPEGIIRGDGWKITPIK